MTGDGQDQ